MSDNPNVLIKTQFGNITVSLFADKAPVTVSNFLTYVQKKLFDESSVFRIVTKDNANQPEDTNTQIQVVQAGLPPEHPSLLAPIAHEATNITGISHTHGTISMARFAPGSADGSFFFCIGDQLELNHGGKRYEDGLGFAAFGRITEGDDVLIAIYEKGEKQEYLENEIIIHSITLL
ncbi:peptidylprolyl isomerase [Pseudoalteromonas sp. GCY]|uniref:peptidylprolyl isomerase n=1 Tax=Pseudoalteromonas sp. GCY TaxID=2003316 RepID=UPI000BFEF75D|nr:peptidylprolyl isomerase [Pseudoalteromonas sp. GCY]PHI35710.1 peptidylprolyl isomerase [Pseudoalteromonas sp. GCY]QQQ67993.1 peptidylprolyl isomerase [Pseudoalteromonas sp. GCY]